jgi:hypothetical protein
MPDARGKGVSVWLKVVAWIAAVILPGGLLLVPILVADEVSRRRGRRTTDGGPTPAEAR